MKIAILTLPLHTNYGGLLQAHALQKVLTQKGHQAIVLNIDRKQLVSPTKQLLNSLKKALYKILPGKTYTPSAKEQIQNEYRVIGKYTQPFIERNITTLHYDSLRKIKKNNFDAIIVGSDQIWRPQYYPVEAAFLDFAQGWNIRRIAYAPSFGADTWEFTPQQTQACSHLIKLFHAVSVRESSGVTLCNQHLNYPHATHVADPTMLLHKEDYEQLIAHLPKLDSDNLIFTYILDTCDEKTQIVSQLCQDYNMTVHNTANPNVEKKELPFEQRIQPPLEEWLRGFRDAKLIVTDSFHACVFSILFNKPFVALGNAYRGLGRIKSLLATYNLEHRLVQDASQLSSDLLTPLAPEVQTILNEWRKESETFLDKALQP